MLGATPRPDPATTTLPRGGAKPAPRQLASDFQIDGQHIANMQPPMIYLSRLRGRWSACWTR